MASLELQGLVKRYQDEPVLNDISLAVASGETLVLFGASGAGKTVLLRAIAGVVELDHGQVFIDATDVTSVEAEHRNVGMAFQNFALFPHMSAHKNISSPLEAQKQSKQAIDEAVGEVSRLLKIDHVLDHAPRELSNGQKQRTALARALVGSPPILLLDDPLRNVDAKLRFEMRLELPRLLADRGATVVYVTQDYKEAMALGDRIAVMAEGRIIQLGTPEQIYQTPSHIETARLFGDPSINLLDVSVDVENHVASARLADVQIALPVADANLPVGDCVMGIRPEHVRFVENPEEGVIPVDIAAETPLNEKTVTLARTKTDQEILISRPAETPGPAMGDGYIVIDSSYVLLFDRDSGQHIKPSGDASTVGSHGTAG